MLRGVISSAQGIARKIPLVGGLLSTAIGFIPAAAFAAVGVIAVGQFTKIAARYIPMVDAKLFYLAAGLGLAALVKGLRFLPISDQLRNQLAGGIVAATGALAAYKHFSGGSLAGEYGHFEYGDANAFGDSGYAVIPGYAGYGSTYQTLYGPMGSTYQTLYGSTYQTLYGDDMYGALMASSHVG